MVPLDEWLPDGVLLDIARENNLSETAYFVPRGAGFHIRWFTPGGEVNLCGHATLASAYVLFHELGYVGDVVRFHSLSGPLEVRRGEKLTLDFPAWPPRPLTDIPETLTRALNCEIVGAHEHRDLLVELEDETTIKNLRPDFGALKELQQCVIVTARGTDCDFVSRFFAPHLGIDEDPVTGSAHTQLTPFWSARLAKNELFAKQLSRRGGDLWCRLTGDRVMIAGECAFFLKGAITLP